jgi:hypothetical protein
VAVVVVALQLHQEEVEQLLPHQVVEHQRHLAVEEEEDLMEEKVQLRKLLWKMKSKPKNLVVDHHNQVEVEQERLLPEAQLQAGQHLRRAEVLHQRRAVEVVHQDHQDQVAITLNQKKLRIKSLMKTKKNLVQVEVVVALHQHQEVEHQHQEVEHQHQEVEHQHQEAPPHQQAEEVVTTPNLKKLRIK